MERWFDILEIRTSATGPGLVARCRWLVAGGRQVAVRPLLSDDPRLRVRLAEQVRRQRGLSHPNLVPLEQLVQLGDRRAVVSAWVEGVSLAELADRRALTPPAVVTLVRRAARAIDALHRAADDEGPLELFHGNPAPTELLLTATGALKLVDPGFDAARQPDDEPLSVPGHLRWRAPERVERALPLGPAADVYGLGLTLFELCAGLPAVLAARPEAHAEAVDRQLGALAGRLPDGWDDLVGLLGEMLAWSPDARPTAAMVVARLGQLCEGVDVARLAESRVTPVLTSRARIDPEDHREWPEVAFLEGAQVETLAALGDDPSDATARADREVRRFLADRTWPEQGGALQYLLATHPAWSPEPFLDLVHLSHLQAERPTPDELVSALRVLQHRCTDDVRDRVRPLVEHRHPEVRQAAAALVGPRA